MNPEETPQVTRVRSKAVHQILLGLIALFLVFLLNQLAVDAFTLADDNPIYFFPYMKAHAESLLSGHVLKVAWDLGAGWSPFESAVVGLAYPFNHVSLVVAKLAGNPLLMLEVSAAIHLWLSGFLTYRLLPRRFGPMARLGLAVMMMLQPAPLLIGRNWHAYLIGYPWFIAMALVVWRGLEGEGDSRWRTWALGGFGALLFLGSHPQIYILGVVILIAWILAESPNRGGLKQVVVELGLTQLPMVIPILYIKGLSAGASAEMMAGRGDLNLALSFAQSARTVIQGLLVGNLAGDGGFHLWSGVEGSGIGMFFCPLGILALGLTLQRRRWLLSALLLLAFGTMAIASFPWLKHLSIGPFAGFRWTWKLSMLWCPLACLIALRHWPRDLVPTDRMARGAIAVQICGAFLVICCGQTFDLLPANAGAAASGLQGIITSTRACLSGAGLPPGTRVAVIGGSDMVQPLPLPILGLMGAAPMLSGYETPCSFEPLEPARISEAHLGLTLPWRTAISAQAYKSDPARVESVLRTIGIQGIVTRFPGLFPAQGTVPFQDESGRWSYVRVIADPTPMAYPFAMHGGQRIPLERLPGGDLKAVLPLASEVHPTLVPGRPVHWEPGPNRSWIARPAFGLGPWILAEGAVLLLWVLMVRQLTAASRPTLRRNAEPPAGG